jgi:hypothetical protein
MRRTLLITMLLVLTGCGARAGGSHGAPAPTPSVSGTNGPFQAVASPSQLRAGDTVHLTLTVTGPIQYEGACVQTLHIWAEDAGHQQVWTQPIHELQCLAIGYKSLAAGQTTTFSADWPTSSQLAPGSYTIHGLFLTALPPGAGMRVRENLPSLTIQISG